MDPPQLTLENDAVEGTLPSTTLDLARVGVEDIPESYEILKIVDRRGEIVTYPDDFSDVLPEAERKWLESLRANVVVPVASTDHRLIGLLILGKKASEEPYIAHDFAILKSLAGQIALAYENFGLHVQVHEQDLVVATQGRSFWILDDLSPLQNLNDAVAEAELHLFAPRKTYLFGGGISFGGGGTAGRNPPGGVMVHYILGRELEEDEELTLKVLDDAGDQFVNGRLLRLIVLPGCDLSSRCTQFLREGIGRLDIEIPDPHPGALFTEAAHGSGADAGGAATDQDGFAL